MSNGELERLLEQDEVTGLASAEVSTDRGSVSVRIHIPPEELAPSWDQPPSSEQVRIFSPIQELIVGTPEWLEVDGVNTLYLPLAQAIGFTTYRLRIDHGRIDPAFREITFRATLDRLQRLLAQDTATVTVTGIDFVHVHDHQQTLDIYFHHNPHSMAPAWTEVPTVEQIRIVGVPGGGGPAGVPVSGTRWEGPDATTHGRQVLRIETEFPGGFSPYRLFIDDVHIDPYFNGVVFSFKAVCESDLDCAPPPHACPPEEDVDFPVDYQARDFWSLRRALLDFASQRYPDWRDRLEADAGVMLAEVMSALGDELAYYQDRIGREAYLETATQRRSVRHHARLVDYEMHDGLAGSTWLDVTVSEEASAPVSIAAGTDVRAESDSGERVDYEVGLGLNDRDEDGVATECEVSAAGNSLEPYIWDEDDTCLSVGATQLDTRGDHAGLFEAGVGRWVLLKTNPFEANQPARRWLVHVMQAEVSEDALTRESVTRLQWEEAQALPFEIDLTVLEVRANLVPATAGRTLPPSYFVIGMEPDDPLLGVPEAVQPTLIRAVERQGRQVDGRAPEACTEYLCSLPESDETPLCWVGEEPREASPEIRLRVIEGWVGDEPQYAPDNPWEWRRSLFGTFASQPGDTHFTLEDGTWRRVVGYQRIGQEIVHRDYASAEGKTVRFGGGEFGQVPARGTVFEVTYRLGNGRRGNVAADSITFDEDHMPAGISAVSNPLPVTNGMDAESLDEVRRLAPDAFRAITYRAVRPEDYAEAAERLPWVQRANAAFRWTGSWVTAFVTADPRGAVAVTEAQDLELGRQIDRFRQAGREAYTADPCYADVDLEATVCVEPFAYPGQVKERVLEALLGRPGSPIAAFFHPDHFSFGTPLWRSRLEAAIQAVEGVRAVTGIRIRRRGVFDWRPLTGPHYPVADQEVIRVENDPDRPERGTLELIMEGGA